MSACRIASLAALSLDVASLHLARQCGGPPAIWSAEVAVNVYFSDGTSEVQYISDIDYGDCGLQVTTISLSEIPEGECIDPYLIAAYESEEEASVSPYADSIKIFRNLFKQIAVI